MTEMATAARCFPAGLRGEPVAGDFFDVISMDDARTMIALGDVVGHGVGAAALMTALRTRNRELLLSELTPAEALARLDQFQCSQGLEALATLWLGTYDRTTDRLDYASAGHPPPILVSDRRARLLTEASAPPLGSGHVGRHVIVETVEFPPGALLVAYSDGLIERPGLDLEEQIETLRASVEQVYEPALTQAALEGMLERLLDQLPHHPAESPDDVCVLLLHRPG